MIVIPFLYNIWALGAVVILQGVSMGLLDTDGNVSILWLFFQKNVEPYMQALHLAFALGAFISPLIIGVVMDNFRENFAIAFITIGGTFVPLVVSLLILPSPTNPHDKEPTNEQQTEKKEESGCQRVVGGLFGSFTLDEFWVILFTACFLCFYVGGEVTMGTFIYTYTIKMELGTEQEAYILNSCFWAALALGRFLAIPISTKLPSHIVLLINLSGCLACSLIMLLLDTNKIALWVSVIFFGLFMASSFPTAFTLAESLMIVTGKAASYFVIGASLGEMITPAIVSTFFQSDMGYRSVSIGLVCSSGLGFIIWLLLMWRRVSLKSRGLLRSTTTENHGENKPLINNQTNTTKIPSGVSDDNSMVDKDENDFSMKYVKQDA
eukprot:TRINITY_DN308_c0_g1_i5.p1 TRINITY_DN308_c0_g1~~TRINITY_DN308_c0_g1_i5.p1  ORF type:complete len:380 (+),score=70.66 TRINITY_DN308_c0_g1_i5:1681-2820(+)